MTWIQEAPDRWTWVEEEHHLLLHSNGVLAELHMRWIHKYQPAVEVPADWPLTDARYLSTTTLAQAPATDVEGWQVLEAAAASDG